ncbi:MAG: hypothetical protein GF329_11485 [Candidatus Lokiarchaeota archaeon]|nr:hypothetical protein [Candidatus Lokiarchaeota archaeon]
MSEKNQNRKKTSDDLKGRIEKIMIDLEKIENFIIKGFKRNNIQFGRDPVTAAIQATFFLYPKLTQKQLQKYTGYSAGAISQALKPLVENKIIEKKEPDDITKPYIYKMPNMLEFTARTFLSIAETYLENKDIFLNIRDGLEKIPDDLHDEPLYRNIHEYIRLIMKYIPLYKQLSQLVLEEIEKIDR